MTIRNEPGVQSSRGCIGRTDSDMGVLGKILRTSRKLAAARNFFAVDLRDDKNNGWPQ